jgi:hypothetical protein
MIMNLASNQKSFAKGALRYKSARVVMAAAAMSALVTAMTVSAGPTPAYAQAQHNSAMNTSECVSVPYVPGDCTGFVADAGWTVQMQCWNTGPKAMGQYKWFEITVLQQGPR